MPEDDPQGSELAAQRVDAEKELRLLLEATLDLSPESRLAYLEAHASSPDLARDVEQLLDRESRLGNFLNGGAIAPLPEGLVDSLLEDVRDVPPPESEAIGPFRLLELLGEGGMGRVYLAEQQAPIVRRVALKLAHRRLGSEAAIRFRLERAILGRLSHSNIARLYEAGATPEGRPFVAMELIEGPSITRFADEKRLDLVARLRLFVSVCRGAEHAHQKQILHRDFKPSNILVSVVEGRPVAKIIDFGIAKSIDPLEREEAQATGDRLLGTPQYMSPEALERSSGEDLDTRSDVYSLGVVLYELLAGVLPFRTPTSDLTRLLHEILSRTPTPPSSRLAELDAARQESLAADRSTTAARLREELAGDLDCIVLKAMARDREERYGSAAALADELDRVLGHEPILARPPSLRYRLGKWTRRHRLAAILVALTAAGLILAGLLTSIALLRAQRAEQRSRSAAQVSRQSLDFLVQLFDAAKPEVARGNPVDVRRLLEIGVERIGHADLEPLPRSQILFALGEVHFRLGQFPRALELATESLEIRRRGLEGHSPEVLESIELVANINRRAGFLDRAEPLLEELVAAAEQDSDPLKLADALNGLGNLRWRQRRSAEAEALYTRSLELRRSNLGPDSQEVAFSHNNLGALLIQDGRYAEAEEHLRRAAELLEKQLGPRHPRVADALGNLAIVIHRLNRFREAEEIEQKVLAIRLEVLGKDHPDTASALHNLAMAQADLGAFQQAEESFRLALDLRLRLLEDGDSETIKTLSNLGLLLERRGKFEEAERLFIKALEQRERLGPAEDAGLLRSRRNLALVWRDTGRLQEARETLEAVLAAERKLLPADHVDIAQALHHLGITARLEKKLEEAAQLLRESSEMKKRLGPSQDKFRADTLFELGQLERSRGREGEALVAYREALELRRRLLPEGHPDLAASKLAVVAAGR